MALSVANAAANLTESSFSITTTAGSAVIFALDDFNATNPPGKTPLAGSGTALELRDAGDAVTHGQWISRWTPTTASTASYGPNNYTSLQVAQAIIEIRSSVGTVSVPQYAEVSSWFTKIASGASKTATGLSWSAGDIIVVVGTIESGSDPVANPINLNVPTNANLTFTQQAVQNGHTNTEAVAYIWTATAGSAQTAQTITSVITFAGGGTFAHGIGVVVCHEDVAAAGGSPPPGIGHPALAFQFIQLHSNGPVATQDFTVTSSAFVGAVALSGSSLAEPSAVSLAALGVLPQSGTARPEPSAVTVARVGVLGQSGGASPSPSAVSQALAGIFPLASSARPEPSAAALALIGVYPQSGTARPEPSAVTRALVGVLATSLPTSTADITVTGLVVVGVVVTSLPIPAPSAAAIALAGVQARSQPVVEPSAIARAYIGAQIRGIPTIAVSPSGLAIVGVQPWSQPTSTSDITVGSLVLVGITARSSGNTITVTGSAIAGAGVQARSLPTVMTTASGLLVVGVHAVSQPTLQVPIAGRVYVGVHTYGLIGIPDGPLVYGPVIVWAEPGDLRFVEPDVLRWWEPSTFEFGEAGLIVWSDPSTMGGE